MPRDKDVKRVVRKRMAETGERYTEARAAIRPARKPSKRATRQEGRALVAVDIPVEGGVRAHLATGQHFVVMQERDGTRFLPIWIGVTEANAIAAPLHQFKLERPLTADLMTSTILTLGGEVERVVITRFESGCFFAEVHVRRDGAPLVAMDARPSDALGIAVRTQAPIFVAAEVMDACGTELVDDSGAVALGHARVQGESGALTQSTTFTPVFSPTHILIDAATDRVVTMLRFAPGVAAPPETGTLLTVGTPQQSVQYRVIGVQPDAGGLTRLRAEVVANPNHVSSQVITTVPPGDR